MLRKVSELTKENSKTPMAKAFLKVKENRELKEQQKQWREKARENAKKFFEEK